MADVSAAGATISVAVTEDVAVGDVLIVACAWDNLNAATTTGPVDFQIRCDDAALNPWRLLVGGQNIAAGASAGAHGMIFGCVLRNPLSSGQNITLTHNGSTTLVAKAVSVRRFSGWGAANIHVPPNGAAAASGAADPASISLSGLPSREYLFLNALAYEGPTTDSFTQDADYTSFDVSGTDSGTDTADQTIRAGFRIATLTGDTVDLAAASRDHKMLLVACYPSDAPFVKWSRNGSTTGIGTGMASATSGAPTTGFNAADEPWTHDGDVAVFVQAGQQTTLIPQPPIAQGFRPFGTLRISTGDITFSGYWKRCDGSENNLDGQDVSQANLGAWLILGGCNPNGTPFINMGEAVEAADTSVEVPGVTTPWDDALILAIAAHGIDSAVHAQYSAWTNANLVDLEEQMDVSSNLLNGVGVGMASGIKETAGAVGTTTATLAASDVDIVTGLAFKPYTAAVPSRPWVRSVLARGENTAALALAWSADDVEANDLIVVFVNSEAQDVTTPTDYTEFPDSPQDTTGCRLEGFYKVADGTETGVTIADSGDHQIAVALAIADVDTTSPVDVTAGGVEASDTSLSATGDTTTVASDLVLVAAAHSTDSSNAQYFGFNNTDLDDDFLPGGTLIEHLVEMTGGSGVGGGVSVAAGGKAAAGAFGATTATLQTASTKAFLTVALKLEPPPAPTTFFPRVISF